MCLDPHLSPLWLRLLSILRWLFCCCWFFVMVTPGVGVLIVTGFVVCYFMSILVLQSSWLGRERVGFFAWFVFLVSCDCCVALPCDSISLSAACDCGISWSYSLTIFGAKSNKNVIQQKVQRITYNLTRPCMIHIKFSGVKYVFLSLHERLLYKNWSITQSRHWYKEMNIYNHKQI